jgi:hypothetical protein
MHGGNDPALGPAGNRRSRVVSCCPSPASASVRPPAVSRRLRMAQTGDQVRSEGRYLAVLRSVVVRYAATGAWIRLRERRENGGPSFRGSRIVLWRSGFCA